MSRVLGADVVRDWVPEDHLVWTVIDAVGELDLPAFYSVYRVDGHGRPAYEPPMMVALWLAIWCPITRRSRTSVFSGVLGRAGLASVGVVAIDGTRISANASMNANRGYTQIARAILREAGEIDAREDELYGPDRGDELPEQLRTREGRRQALRARPSSAWSVSAGERTDQTMSKTIGWRSSSIRRRS